MQRLFILTLLLLLTGLLPAQSLKKYPIGNSGCNFYSYCTIPFTESKSADSSRIWSGECVKDELHYGVICVKLLNPVAELPAAEDLLISYADYLKSSFQITSTMGYGRGHLLQQQENTRGIIDYWNDAEKNNWKIKAWTDGKFIGFLFVYSLKELPEQKINVFLDGFRLPE